MKIVALETVRSRIQPNLCFVQLHSDNGLIGLGETFYGAHAVETYLHDHVVDELANMPEVSPEAAAARLAPYTGYQGGGAETRGNGAIDIALWDLLAQAAHLPLVELLGGRVREHIAAYNTCAGTRYVSDGSRQHSQNWGLDDRRGEYEDLHAFLTRPGELAAELRDEGFTGMKIWPFDTAAESTGGVEISPADLDAGIAIVAQIRETVGYDMRLMIELHSLWNPGPAARICQRLAPYDPTWVEDPLRGDAVEALARLRRDVEVPIATGETIVGRRGFLPLLNNGAIDVVTVDTSWTGGLTEARKIAALADTFGVPVAPHDCTGPVSLAVSTHLVCGQPNGYLQETARAFSRTWYHRVATGMPEVRSGHIAPGHEPGHGVRLRPDLFDSPGTSRRFTQLENTP